LTINDHHEALHKNPSQKISLLKFSKLRELRWIALRKNWQLKIPFPCPV